MEAPHYIIAFLFKAILGGVFGYLIIFYAIGFYELYQGVKKKWKQGL